MLKALIMLLGVLLINSGLLGKDIDRKSQTSLLEKFQQHDYQMNFERGEISSYNKKYLRFANIATFKYNRTCPLINASVLYEVDVSYKLEFIVQAYKFCSNEYRLFPARFQMNFCQALAANIGGIGNFRRCGTFASCHIVKRKLYTVCNWAPNPAMFPPFLPNGQYMMEVQLLFQSVEICTMRGYGSISRLIPV